jgi:hypothetical protein
MAINIGQMTTEIIAEPEQKLAGASAVPATDRLAELAKIRFAVAEAAELDQRTRAEGYDD